ncbi:MAG: hypothetical protein O7G87_22950, partial [bacterium]|nr:hypothetical protein [bacterium]
ERRCYATTGARIYIDFRINNHPMGSTVQASDYAFTAEILGTAKIDRVELMLNGSLARTFTPKQQHITLDGILDLPFSVLGIYYCYLRLRQQDGQRAWTSPIWLEQAESR